MDHKQLKLHKDNPFTNDVHRMLNSSKNYNKTFTSDGILASEEITVTYRREYLPFVFTKMFHNKELLGSLTPWGCKILVYIALNLEYNQQKIKLSPALVSIDKRKFSTTIAELIFRRILVKEKREYYWINVTLIIVGNLKKPEKVESLK